MPQERILAAQKKKSSKKTSTKSKGKSPVEPETPFIALLAGWFLVAFGVILLLGCVSSVYSGSDGNWLGPYLAAFSTYALMRRSM